MHTAASPFPNSSAAYPRDLRSGSPATAGAGKIYDVDPAAVERLNAFMASAPQRIRPPLSNEKTVVVGNGRKGTAAAKSTGDTTMENPKKETEKAATKTAVGVPGTQSTSRSKNGDAPAVDPAAVYPAAAIEAARKQREVHGRRDLVSVFTPDVLAVWHRWHEEDGRTMAWIAKHNGLLKITTQQVSDYLQRYREALAESEPAEPSQETAVPQPEPEPGAEPTTPPDLEKPEVEPMETAVAPFEVEKPENLPSFFDREYRPRPRPGDSLGALVQLLNDERVTVKGSVQLNVQIEFGGQ